MIEFLRNKYKIASIIFSHQQRGPTQQQQTMNCDNMSHKFEINDARDALLEILKQIDQDQKLRQIKENCSNDMLRYVQSFVPLTMEIQFKVISRYGFAPDSNGLICFTNKIKDFVAQDDLVASLFDNFKNILVPPLNLRTQCV